MKAVIRHLLAKLKGRCNVCGDTGTAGQNCTRPGCYGVYILIH